MRDNISDNDIVITSAFRTPIGSFLGSLSDHSAVQLGTEVIKKCIEHSKLENSDVDLSALKAAGIVNRNTIRAKVIASGKIERVVVLRGISATKGAREAIEQAGGRVES